MKKLITFWKSGIKILSYGIKKYEWAYESCDICFSIVWYRLDKINSKFLLNMNSALIETMVF